MSDLWTKCMAAWLVAFALAASTALAQQASEEAEDPQPSPATADAEEDADREGEQADQEGEVADEQEPEEAQAGEEEPALPGEPQPAADTDEPAEGEEPAAGTEDPAKAERPDARARPDEGARDRPDRRAAEGRRDRRAAADAELDMGLSFSADRDNRLVINNIEEQSTLAAAGIQRGDVLLSVNDRRIGSQRDFYRWIRQGQPGSRIALRVLRNGRPETVFVRYVDLFPRGYREQFRVDYDDPGAGPRATLGVVLDRRYDRGARVQSVSPGSPAERAGLRPGDIIVRLDDERVGSPADLIEIVAQRQPGDTIDIQVVRPLQARLAAAAGGPPAPVEGRVYSEGESEFIEGDQEIRTAPDLRGRTRVRIGREGAILDRDRDGRRLEIVRPRN